MQEYLPTISKTAAACAGGLLAYLEPTLHYAMICLFAIFLDCLTAWQLERRVRRKRKINATAHFSSKKMSKIFSTMLQIFGVIVLSFLIDKYILTFADLYLANIVSGAFCMCQIWSVLENISSENEARWARLLQKVMVSKVARHLEIDITEKDLSSETDSKA